MIDIVTALRGYHVDVDVFDPWVDAAAACAEHELSLVQEPRAGHYDAIVLAVAHDQFVALGAEGIKAFGKTPHVLFDVKNCLPQADVTGRL